MAGFIHTGLMAVDANWSAGSGRHFHDYTEIMVMAGGGIGVWADGAEVEAYRGDALFNELSRQSEPEPPSELKRVRDYMKENLSRELNLDTLAAQACMSRYYFVRWYRRNTGTTPIRDLRRMRVDAACDLMRGSDVPLKQIAERTGFCDEYYFSRVFREHVGIPPGAFRRTRPQGNAAGTTVEQ